MSRPQSKKVSQTELTKVPVRRATHEKFNRIRKAKRWTFIETADVLADEYLSNHKAELQPTA